MANTVIKVEHLSKYYRLGLIGAGTLREDVSRMMSRLRGKTDPLDPIHGHMTGRDQGEIWALNDVNFEVSQGEILGIIGKNGAGKSTLLKVLSRITAPTSGRIKMKGRVGSLLEVGTGFHEELTGRENVYLNGAILGMTRQEVSSKLDEIIEFAEMAQFIDTPVKRYSSGMRVRLAFSVAAHLEPEILIIDEVLAVGDIEFQNKCIGKMESVAGHGRTVLFVSHNMNIVQNLCTRGIIIDHGSVGFDGGIQEATNLYMTNHGEALDISKEKFRGVIQNKIRFTHLTVNGHDLAARVGVNPSQPITISLSGINQALIKDAEIFIALFCDGYRLATMFDQETTTPLIEGEFTSTFVIPPNLLQPGQYALKIGAQSPRLKEWMISDFIGGFEVSAQWDALVQERKVGSINITNSAGKRTQ
ncbi:ABC transporter ATP-binding protein [Arenicella chitinivorans]|uniref:ABC transporter ATP-binding protein n=1 Tax=Arenicella chitinivorans TaxID=1329800 RepID=A0A918VM38_9GAMM|nr:ABC transporter ATP-binding protein [Arenicella chitinivorans]GHA08415.1 ABC transporter ATP-binding protein [Arenicella chitinivorans]